MPRARALFLAPMLPARGGNGLAMRLGLFLEALVSLAEVDLIVIPVAGGQVEDTSYVKSFGASLSVIALQEQDRETHFRLLSRLADPALRQQAFAAYGKPSLSMALSPSLRRKISSMVECTPYRLIHVGRSYLTPLTFDLPAHIPVTLDLDEDDRQSFASRATMARRAGNEALGHWLEQEGIACDALIAKAAARACRMFAASDMECRSIGHRHGGLTLQTVGNAVDLAPRHCRRNDGRTLLFVGSFGYEPNIEAILWFAKKVMPLLRAKNCATRLLVAGADPPPAVRRLERQPQIRILGLVEDLCRLYAEATLVIAPMQSGGGTRIKVLEAAAHGVASVVSGPAARGLFTRREPWGWICSTPTQFAAACLKGLEDGAMRQRYAQAGRRAVSLRHARPAVVRRLAAILRDCMSADPRAA